MKDLVDKIYIGMNAVLICFLLIFAALGCQDPSEIAKQQDAAQGKQQEAGGDAQKQEMPEGGMAEQAVQNVKPGNQGAPQNNTKKSIIHKTTAVVVDAKKALKNPEISVVDGKIKGVDPFTQAGSAYFSMASRVSTLGMQQAIKAYKALNDKFPSYDEYMKMMKENRVEFAQLPPYKMYGYDDETGNILVLQDNKKKAELYKEAGIPLD
ncbi:hypothetical protein [Gimesia aquarii]|uniref:Lipoprotein n=1 Tax=Gimesia aquarii TaxID=2527964 RepID=A0A517WRH8_9PLAN|nr:hypothetical protein [Gimesia aquarii]QDU07853.1 hypothetical protein V202x_12140 [Gimesia aquarii]